MATSQPAIMKATNNKPPRIWRSGGPPNGSNAVSRTRATRTAPTTTKSCQTSGINALLADPPIAAALRSLRAKSLSPESFPTHSHLALDKGFVCWSVSTPLRPPPMGIRVYKSPVLYGAGTANFVSRLVALGIDATLSECQISQHNRENHGPNNCPKHETSRRRRGY
jgi:hypothetical protein